MTAALTLSALVALSTQQLEAAHAAGALSFGQGTTHAADEAAWLVLWRLGLPLDIDWADPMRRCRLSKSPRRKPWCNSASLRANLRLT